MADQALEVLEVETDGQFAALDRFERVKHHVGQKHRHALHVLGGAERLAQEPPGVEPLQGQLAEQGMKLAGDVKMRVERAADPFNRHQGADQEDEVGGNMQAVSTDEDDQFLEQRAEVERVEVEFAIRGDQLGGVAAQGPRIDVFAANLQRVEGTDDPVGVLGEKTGEEVGDPLAGPAVELAEHPVVERDDHAVGEHPQISRMRVGMEKTEPEDLLEQDPRPPDGDLGGVEVEPSEALNVGDADPADELHRDHPVGRELADDEGDVGGRIVGELSLAPFHRPPLDVEIELARQAPLELSDERRRGVRQKHRQVALGELGEVLEDVEIGLDQLLDARPPDLQRDGAAVEQHRLVNLRD